MCSGHCIGLRFRVGRLGLVLGCSGWVWCVGVRVVGRVRIKARGVMVRVLGVLGFGT